MDNSVTKSIANEAKKNFVSFITTSVNSLYYKNNITGLPEDKEDKMLVTMDMLGLNVGDIVLPATDPNYIDEEISGFYVKSVNDSEIVTGLMIEEGFDIDIEDCGLTELYSICSQVEILWRKAYNK